MKPFILITILLSSCTYADKDRVVFVGGKGAYKSKQFALTTDNEKSFNDAAWVSMAAIPAIQAVKIATSADKLSAVKDTNAAGVATQTIKSNEAISLGAQSADVTKAITLPK